jgi:hypothetical protein
MKEDEAIATATRRIAHYGITVDTASAASCAPTLRDGGRTICTTMSASVRCGADVRLDRVPPEHPARFVDRPAGRVTMDDMKGR